MPFVKNEEYVDLLITHASLTKRHNFSNIPEYSELQKKLLNIERKLSSEEIIKNTKIAFPNSISYAP